MAGLSSDDVNVQKMSNVPNVYSTIMKYIVPPGVVVNFPMYTRVVMKLYNTSGDEIDEKSQIVVKYKKSDYVTEETMLTRPERYFKFKNLTKTQQLSADSAVTFKMTSRLMQKLQSLGSDVISFPESYVIMVQVNSPDAVSWDNDSFIELSDVDIAE